jgi:hypothetical protein
MFHWYHDQHCHFLSPKLNRESPLDLNPKKRPNSINGSHMSQDESQVLMPSLANLPLTKAFQSDSI